MLSEVERRWGAKRGAKVVKVGVKQGVQDGRVPKGVKRQSASASQGAVRRDSASAKQRVLNRVLRMEECS